MIAVRKALTAIAILAFSTVAQAADWVERPYNPPVGSRWIVTAETVTDEVRSTTGPRNVRSKMRSEFSVESKRADGFKVVYVLRDIEIDGTSPTVGLLRQVGAAMKDITVRATLNAAGKPVRVDNIEEARASMRKVIDRMMAMFQSKPQVAKLIEDMLNNMLMVDAVSAADMYLEYMPQLALGQQTGLKIGEVRRSTETAASPLGGGAMMRSNVALQIVRADADTGEVSLLQTTTYDGASVKEAVAATVKQLLSAAGDKLTPAQFDEFVKKTEMSLDGRLEIEVEDGMTRRLRETTDTRAALMGHVFTKREVKTVTVTRAP